MNYSEKRRGSRSWTSAVHVCGADNLRQILRMAGTTTRRAVGEGNTGCRAPLWEGKAEAALSILEDPAHVRGANVGPHHAAARVEGGQRARQGEQAVAVEADGAAVQIKVEQHLRHARTGGEYPILDAATLRCEKGFRRLTPARFAQDI